MQVLSTARLAAALAATATIAAALIGSPVHAQVRQRSFSLNETAPGTEYLSVATKNGLEGNSAYTIEAWVYPTSYDNFPTIVGNDYHTSFWLGLNLVGRVRFYPRGFATGFVEPLPVVPLGRWTHVAAVYDAATGYAIYLNGALALAGSSITGAPGTSAGDLRIGADREPGGPDYFWRGYLDDVRIWNVARTATEVRNQMFVGVGIPGAFDSGVYDGLVATWANDYPYPSFALDFGDGVLNHATFVNGDYLTHTTFAIPFGPPVAPNVALQLNGVDDRVVLPVTEEFERGVTVMAWIAPTDVSGFPTIVGREFTSSFWLGLTPAGRLRFYPTGGTFIDGLTPIAVGDRWTHVAATYDGERTALYINGQVDRVSTDVSGPVGANGREALVGADHGVVGVDYPFAGYLDEVVVAQGALSRHLIRRWMFHSIADAVPVFGAADQDGVPIDVYHASFDVREDWYDVLGSGGRLVRGGTPEIPHFAEAGTIDVESFAWNFGGGSTLPDDDLAVAVGSNLDWPLNQSVAEVEVFVSAPLTDLAQSKLRLRSPSDTWVMLMGSSEAVGRDLLTVISDAATRTWATGFSPFYDGVRPSEPLSGFNGEEAQGTWRLEISTAGTGGVGLWAWGLRINGDALDVEGAVGDAIALRLAGSNPVHGTGALAFDLPHAARVDLGLYDLQGREVLPILAGDQAAGAYRMSFSTGGLGAGVYFARLRVDDEERGSVKVSVVR